MADWQKRHSVIPAVFVILERDGKVLLLRRANTGYRDGFYSLPAGHLDGGESAAIAAARECAEEVGVVVDPAKLQLVHITHRVAEEGNHERVDFYFKAAAWEGEPVNNEPDKCDDVRWTPYSDLPTSMVPSVRTALECAVAGKIYADIGF